MILLVERQLIANQLSISIRKIMAERERNRGIWLDRLRHGLWDLIHTTISHIHAQEIQKVFAGLIPDQDHAQVESRFIH